MKTSLVKNFSLKATLESGQLFRWQLFDGWYYVVVGSSVIKARQEGTALLYECSDASFDVPSFFGLKDGRYSSIIKKISQSDERIAAAVRKYNGMRILRQQPWECTASFICSSFSNIKRIRKNLNAVAAAYGSRISCDGYSAYCFPSASDIAENSEKLKGCGLGYRAKYLEETARIVSNGFSFESVRKGKCGYVSAKARLMELSGVGEKVADCILLFSLGFSEAFPVDVWIERAMRQHRIIRARASLREIAEAGRRIYGRNAGYAQQFLYHYARNSPFANRKL